MKLINSVPNLSLDSANFIEHDESYWEILPYFEDRPNYQVGGGNGQIFRIINPIDGEEFILKISKFSTENSRLNNFVNKRILRFYREIEALKIAIEDLDEGIVEIYGDGEAEIEGHHFPYFIMEKCDCNLKEYLLNNEIPVEQRILLCFEVAKTFNKLHQIRIYHRDIKAENIFMKGDKPIIGDLGLVDNRDSDFIIPEKGDIIGPIGWMSPESTNKFLVEKTKLAINFNCKIGSYSDVFQLGKLFWYIMQGNLPIGQIIFDDFRVRDQYLFELIFGMLQYHTDRRIKIVELEEKIKVLFPKYYL